MTSHRLRLALLPLIAVSTVLIADDLTPLRYNNPGLRVDLGVGLWAWPVPCDADADGDWDLIVSCPDKPSNGVWFFENTTGDTASNKFPIFKPGRRLSRTVHYVMPSYVNGQLRVLTPGKEHPQFQQRGIKISQPLNVAMPIHVPKGNAPNARANKIRHNQWRYVDFDGNGALDLVVGIEDWSDYGWDDAWNQIGEWKNGPLHGFVYWLRNEGSTETPRYASPTHVTSAEKPVDTYGCPTPNFEDFDKDGDLDLLCGEFLDGFTYFENVGNRANPRYAAARPILSRDASPLTMELEMIVPIAFDWDRDGDMDLVVGQEDGRVALVENTGELRPDRTPQFLEPRFFQQEADELKCGALATPHGFDWDGDGDFDIVSGNTAGFIEWFENLSGPKVPEPKWAAPRRLEAGGRTFRVMAGKNGSIQGPAEAKWGYTTIGICDWDLDDRPDIVFNSIWGRAEWLRNIGTREKPSLDAPRPIEVAWNGAPAQPAWTWFKAQSTELVTQWRTTPIVRDFDGDGLPDLAMLDVEGYLAFFRRDRHDGRLVLMPPERAFVDQESNPIRLNDKRAGGSGRRKIAVVDWNQDGILDLLTNSTSADLWLGKTAKDPPWHFTRSGPIAKRNIEGHDVSPTIVDFDGDRVFDFLGGAEDGKLYFLKNSNAR